MDYEQLKAMSAEDLKTSLQKQEIEVDINEHYIGRPDDSYDALGVMPREGDIGASANLDEISHTVERGRDCSGVLSGVTESLKGSSEYIPKPQVSDPTNYAEMKNKLAMEVVPAEWNAGTFQSAPREQMEDIAVIYRLVLDSSKDVSSAVLITNDLMGEFGIVHEQLHNDAMKNAPPIHPAEIKGMEETLSKMQGGSVLEPDPNETLFVTGIPNQNHGAAVIAYPNFFEDVAEKLGGNCFIIPSSIHEMLLVKDISEMNVRDLVTMIREVNVTGVTPEDVLTDHAYHYDSKEHIFESVDKFEERWTEMKTAGLEEDGGSLVDQLNAKKEEAAKEAPEKAAKDATRKSRGGKAL